MWKVAGGGGGQALGGGGVMARGRRKARGGEQLAWAEWRAGERHVWWHVENVRRNRLAFSGAPIQQISDNGGEYVL